MPIRIKGRVYKKEDKHVILVLDKESKEKLNAPAYFFKVHTGKCITEDPILLTYGYIGDVSVLVNPKKYSFDTDKGRIEGTSYHALSIRKA